jgi:HEAT repeat protein
MHGTTQRESRKKMTRPLLGAFALLLSSCLSVSSPTSAAQTDSTSPPNAEHARAILKEGLQSKDFVTREEAITAMSMIGRNEILLMRLEGFLHDKNVEVRLAAVHALADHSPQSEGVLRQTLTEEKTPEVSFAAAKILAGLHDPAGLAALSDVYQRKRKTRSGILKEKKRSFLDEFHSTESAMMFLVGKGIGYMPLPGAGEGFSAIGSLLRDRAVSDRAQALLILCRTKSPESRRLLGEALHDQDWSVRAMSAQIIAHTAETELRDSLLPLFEDKSQKVRFRAAGAYLRLLIAAKQLSANPGTIQ